MHPDKKVWVEEATGTWCGWCPRGEVYMNYLYAKYPEHFVGIAVHQKDPMECKDWIGQQGMRKPYGYGGEKKIETSTGLS